MTRRRLASSLLTRFRFEFELDDDVSSSLGISMRCGVTALDKADGLALVAGKLFSGDRPPPVLRCIEDVDVRTLDQNHVLPNMKSPAERGIWYPPGYD